MKNKFAIGVTIAALTGFASSFSLAAGDGVKVGDIVKLGDGPGNNGGGAFNASVFGPTGTGPVKGSFQTFCLEFNEYFSGYSSPLRVNAISTGAVNGGISGQTSSNLDPISNSTAFLYTQFRDNTNPLGYLNTVNHGTALQLAFWVLENEIAHNSSSLNSTPRASTAQQLYLNYFQADGTATAIASLTGNMKLIADQAEYWIDLAQDTTWATNYIGNVRVMNLVNLDGSNSQDQLTMVPEPETYAMMLAGLGLIGFMARRRRKLV